MNATFVRNNLVRVSALLFTLAAVAADADPSAIRIALQSPKDRKPAANFILRDAGGRRVKLTDYRHKVVLLDFWATWCHGCKQEIPWFSEFERKYSAKGLVVVGISMDEGGWGVLKPFLADNKVPYRMLLGDDSTAKGYGIQSLPGTFLIDHKGKIAAAYPGMVDKENIEANIKMLLSKR